MKYCSKIWITFLQHITGTMHKEEFIADSMIKVGCAVISADWQSADRLYFSDFRLYTHAA